MINYKIESEDSTDALRYIDCKDKNVLDLGCGRWCSREGSWDNLNPAEFSPYFIASKGAKKIIGVDISQNEINIFNDLTKDEPIGKFEFICDKIERADQLTYYIKKYDINYVKSDIEGYEICFLSLSKDDLKNIDTFVLEYHTHNIRDLYIQKFPEWGFEVIANGETWAQGVGVLFAEKIK